MRRSRSPDRPGLHYLVGNILWKLRDYDAAIPELEAEQRRTPDLDAAIDDHVGDDLLRLVFISCHPVLATEARGIDKTRVIVFEATAPTYTASPDDQPVLSEHRRVHLAVVVYGGAP